MYHFRPTRSCGSEGLDKKSPLWCSLESTPLFKTNICPGTPNDKMINILPRTVMNVMPKPNLNDAYTLLAYSYDNVIKWYKLTVITQTSWPPVGYWWCCHHVMPVSQTSGWISFWKQQVNIWTSLRALACLYVCLVMVITNTPHFADISRKHIKD